MKNSELAKSYLYHLPYNHNSTALFSLFNVPHTPTPSDVNKDLISFLNYVSKRFLSNASYDNIKNFVLHNIYFVCLFLYI